MDKKNIEIAAERYVDLLADYGVDDPHLRNAWVLDLTLDGAINYFPDIDAENYEEDDPWDDED